MIHGHQNVHRLWHIVKTQELFVEQMGKWAGVCVCAWIGEQKGECVQGRVNEWLLDGELMNGWVEGQIHE